MCLQTLPREEYRAMKGFRITHHNELFKRKGIACQNLQDLKIKIINKFSSSCKADDLKIFTEDGTEVDEDEYLMSLPNNSILLISDKNEAVKNISKSSQAENIFDHILTMLRWSGDTEDVYQQVLEFMREDFQSKWSHMKATLVDAGDEEDRSHLSSKLDDPDWFQDLSTTAKTKEEFMFKNCQSRIRGYLSRAEAQLGEFKLSGNERGSLENVISSLKLLLKENNYHGLYFDRRAEDKERICDPSGLFLCEGRYNEESCNYASNHNINPYKNYESRILFSTWNLDHLVERSRSIIPSLVTAVQQRKRRKLNIAYFYQLLFTRDNLRLVHIVCHDKTEHSTKKCDNKKFYI